MYGARRCTPRYYRAFTITDATIGTRRWETATQRYRKNDMGAASGPGGTVELFPGCVALPEPKLST